MAGSVRTWTEIEALLRRATNELERAGRAGAIAARHERLVRTSQPGPTAQDLHEKMAKLNRQLAQRHLTAARIHRGHAERLRAFLGSPAEGVPPAFMAAVAETSGADSALLSLFGHNRAEAFVVTSDKIAAAAHDLEAALDEGPGRDAAADGELVAAGEDMLGERWPLYGPAAARLGIHAAAAVPLGIPGRCLGTLTVFGLRPGNGGGDESLGTVADALTHTMLLADGGTNGTTGDGEDVLRLPIAEDGGVLRLPLPAGDRLAVVHQAAGMIAGECGCSIADALAIIRAHSFAHSDPVERVAAKVVRRELRLGATMC